MKILCYFKPGPLEAAYVTARLTMKKLGIEEEMEFLIDTGASRTIISDRDVQWLGIDYHRLRKVEASIGIGGIVDTFTADDAALTFPRDDGKQYTHRFERVFILKHKRVDDRIRRILSILGRDFLNRFALVLDKRQEKAIITDEKI